MTLFLRYSARSERGFSRSNNEDSAFAGKRLLALADGMGGQVGGEVASTLVIAEFAPLNERSPGDDLLEDLRQATARANAAIARRIEEEPALDGMGTTLTALLFDGERLGVVHVGDSRAYLLRDDSFTQITKDETLVQSLLDEGRLTPEEAWNHPRRSMVLRAMSGRDLEPSLELREAKPGDVYLICSDGLSDVIKAGALAETLRANPDPRIGVQRLVELGLRADSHDNVTVVVGEIVDRDLGYDIALHVGAVRESGALAEI